MLDCLVILMTKSNFALGFGGRITQNHGKVCKNVI